MVAIRFSSVVVVALLSMFAGTLAAPLPMPTKSGNVSPTPDDSKPLNPKRQGTLIENPVIPGVNAPLHPPPIPQGETPIKPLKRATSQTFQKPTEKPKVVDTKPVVNEAKEAKVVKPAEIQRVNTGGKK